MRCAIYFTPSREHPLTRAAAAWLGRDAFGNVVTEPVEDERLSAREVAFHTASARRYGFHATIKAPFELADGQTLDALDAALADFARQTRPVTIDRLVLARLDGFFALVPQQSSAALQELAGEVVRSFDDFRAPLSQADIARRNPEALTAAEVANLLQWGYPYVFETFQFHMTLTGRVAGEEEARVRAVLERRFAPFIDAPLAVDGLALFEEPEPGAPFVVRSHHALTGDEAEPR